MKKPTGASTPPTDGIERITSAGTPLADEATEERPPVKRPRSPPSNLVVAEPLPPIADSDDDSLAKKRRLESGTPPPPAISHDWPVRVQQPARIVEHEWLPPHTDWKWSEPGLLGPKDYEEVGQVEYGHSVTVSTWRDDETGVLLTRVSASHGPISRTLPPLTNLKSAL